MRYWIHLAIAKSNTRNEHILLRNSFFDQYILLRNSSIQGSKFSNPSGGHKLDHFASQHLGRKPLLFCPQVHFNDCNDTNHSKTMERTYLISENGLMLEYCLAKYFLFINWKLVYRGQWGEHIVGMHIIQDFLSIIQGPCTTIITYSKISTGEESREEASLSYLLKQGCIKLKWQSA